MLICQRVPLRFFRSLVGGDWNTTGLVSHSVGNVIIPTDALIFFGGAAQPPTSLRLFRSIGLYVRGYSKTKKGFAWYVKWPLN